MDAEFVVDARPAGGRPQPVTAVTSWGKGAGEPATGGRPETVSFDAPAWLGTKITVAAQDPALDGLYGRGIENVPAPEIDIFWSVAGRPVSAALALDTWNSR